MFLTSEKKRENPKTNRLRVEFRSTNWVLDSPTADTMPNMIKNMPPTMGSGTVAKTAPILLMTPKKIMQTAPN